MGALPREVWRWLQSLQLSVQVRNVRRDISNGYVVAEVLSKYFPSKVQLHNFDKGSAIDKKLANWQLLQKVFTSEGIDIDPHYINGCIHCKPGAAEPIITALYTSLTKRTLPEMAVNIDREGFSDIEYQASLPSYARSTASVVHDIIAKQQQLKRFDKETDPWRYGINPPRATGHRVRPPTRGTQRLE